MTAPCTLFLTPERHAADVQLKNCLNLPQKCTFIHKNPQLNSFGSSMRKYALPFVCNSCIFFREKVIYFFFCKSFSQFLFMKN